MTCVSNKICVKGLSGAVGHKWKEIEEDIISARRSSMMKYEDVPFPEFVLVRKPAQEPKVNSNHQLPELEKHLYSFKNAMIVKCAEQDSDRVCSVAK